MSLYSIAAASLTTPDDHRRQPVVDGGQVLRTFVLCLGLAAAFAAFQHRGHSGSAGTVLATVTAETTTGTVPPAQQF